MSTDRIVSIRFDVIPINEVFVWNKQRFTKINETEAKTDNGNNFVFPLNFKVDMGMTKVEKILGNQIECGIWK